MRRRVSLIALLLYAAVAAPDMAAHVGEEVRAGRDWRLPGNLAVGFSASLFWPVDLAAGALLGR